jgi:ribosome-associated protein
VGQITEKSVAVQSVAIESEYITLGQFLKFARIIDDGGMAKNYLASHAVTVNGVAENRRGRKLRPGDSIGLEAKLYQIAQKQ